MFLAPRWGTSSTTSSVNVVVSQKKLVLGLKKKIVRGEEQYQVADSLPNLQKALVVFFEKFAPDTKSRPQCRLWMRLMFNDTVLISARGNLTSFTIYVNPVDGEKSVMIAGQRSA